jgi:hypothetical protein
VGRFCNSVGLPAVSSSSQSVLTVVASKATTLAGGNESAPFWVALSTLAFPLAFPFGFPLVFPLGFFASPPL